MFTGTTETAMLQLCKFSVCEFTDFKTLVTLPINVEKHPKRPNHMYVYHTMKTVATAVIAAATDDDVAMTA
jgi:hypothetical protein